MNLSELSSPQRDELVAQLDSARRAVGAARLSGDPSAEAIAHARVHSVKRALGAPAEPWWEDRSCAA